MPLQLSVVSKSKLVFIQNVMFVYELKSIILLYFKRSDTGIEKQGKMDRSIGI